MKLKEELHNQTPSLESVKHAATKAKAQQMQLIKRQQAGLPWYPMNHSTPGLLVNHQLPEFTQTHVH